MRCSLLAAVLASSLILADGALGEWQGREVVVDGDLHVINPESPAEEATVELEMLWRQGGDDDEVFFGFINQVATDPHGNVCVLDGQLGEISIFTESGDHLRTVGRKGEAPGEFNRAYDMFLDVNGVLNVLSAFPSRVVRIGVDGTAQDDGPIPEHASGTFAVLGSGRPTRDGFVMSYNRYRSEGDVQKQIHYLKSFDWEGHEVASFHEQPWERRYTGMEFVESTLIDFSQRLIWGADRWAAALDGRVAAALDFDAYRVHVWNPDGSLDRIIERPDATPLKRSERAISHYDKVYEGWVLGTDASYQTSEAHAPVQQIWFREDGSLWVLSDRGRWATGDGIYASIDEYDAAGRYVRRVHFALDGDSIEDGLYFEADRLYRVTNHYGALLTMMHEGMGDDAVGEPEPVTLIAYRWRTR